MKVKLTQILVAGALAIAVLASLAFRLQQSEPWTQAQLIEPEDLSAVMNNAESPKPLVLSVGPAAVIRNSVDIGPGQDKSNLENLREHLKDTPRDEAIVIYCGCCPFDKCPNIRPAFSLLNEMKFKNHKLLNIRQNIKVNWIDLGYPVSE